MTGSFPVGVDRHSKKLEAGIKQRRRRSAVRNEGFSAAVSARALIIRV
jgi:hypothetical protein